MGEVQRYDIYLRHGELHRVESENGCSVKFTDHAEKVRELEAELDSPVCRLQLPDGSVPTNARDGVEKWYAAAQAYRKQVVELEAAVEELAKGIYVGTMLGYGREFVDLQIAKVTNPIAAAAIQKARNDATQ